MGRQTVEIDLEQIAKQNEEAFEALKALMCADRAVGDERRAILKFMADFAKEYKSQIGWAEGILCVAKRIARLEHLEKP